MTINNFALFRILGNSLPPRHRFNETVENLRFILQHEPEFEHCEKWWVLNRIADESVENTCIQLIQSAGHQYIRIPFHLDEYALCFLDGAQLPRELLSIEKNSEKQEGAIDAWAAEWQYRHKSLYAISLNLARNYALHEGQKRARWTLPWDGSCFITATAWLELKNLAENNNSALHLIVPLVRILDNNQLLDPNFIPHSFDEPQIAFRSDSLVRFDEQLRYGHLNKAELLQVLNVPGPWQKWQFAPWDTRARRASVERGKFAKGTWVARLCASGDPQLETNENLRWRSRFVGMRHLCDKLDHRIVEHSRQKTYLHCYSRQTLNTQYDLSDTRFRTLIERARTALIQPPPTIMDKSGCAPTGDKRDYISASPYHHALKENSSVIFRDGVRNPHSILFGHESNYYDRTSFERFIQNTCAAALTAAVTDEKPYQQYAADLLRTWFINDKTRMNPHMDYAQVIPAPKGYHQPFGIIDFRNLWPLLDAITLTHKMEALTDTELNIIKYWFIAFRKSILKNCTIEQPNNIGIWQTLVITAISLFIGDTGYAALLLSKAPLRMMAQLSAFSVPHLEISRAQPMHYSLFNLQAWICLAWLARSVGIDLWKYSTSLHRSISMQLRFIALNKSCFIDYEENVLQYDQRIATATYCIPTDAADYDRVAELNLTAAPIILDDPNYGIPPLWPAFKID